MIELGGVDTVCQRAAGVRVGRAFRIRGDRVREVHQAARTVIQRTRAARLLGLTRSQLYSRLEKYGLS